jgi:hypothetical protein
LLVKSNVTSNSIERQVEKENVINTNHASTDNSKDKDKQNGKLIVVSKSLNIDKNNRKITTLNEILLIFDENNDSNIYRELDIGPN